MDEFLDWLLECYSDGELTDEDIDRALNEEEFAYDLFLDCWKCDKTGTGRMAQDIFKEAREIVKRRKRGKPST